MWLRRVFVHSAVPVFLAFFALFVPHKATGNEYTLFSSGNWQVFLSAPQDTSDRACIASGAFSAGFFSILVFSDQIMVSIYDESLKITEAVRGSVIVRVSGNGVDHSESIRVGSNGHFSQRVVMSRDIDEHLLDAIMRGLNMEIVYPDNTKWDISLSGSYASVTALADCVDQYLYAPSQSPNPWR